MINPIHSLGPRRVVTIVLALGLAGIVAVPAISAAYAPATAATQAPATAATSGTAGQVDLTALDASTVKLGGNLLKRVVRGDLVVRAKGGTFVTVHYERGKISAANATSITIACPDGTSASFALTATTRVRSAGHLAKIGDLAVGRNALVFGTGVAGSYTAVLVRQPAPKAATNPAQ